MRFISTLCVILLFSFASFSQEVAIIPKPVSLKIGKGTFTISKKTVIAVKDDEDRKSADFFNDYLQQFYGFKLDIDKQESKNYIRLTTRTFIKAPDKDGYTLNVTANGVTIEGDTHTGTFYGMQSLIQLLPVQPNVTLAIPFVSINDYPRFGYRGMHLDVGRHFFPVSFVKKYIDFIALHKMNYFHWHLTEDQGWRIEIKKYPKLTEIGGCRNGTIIGHYPGTGNDSIHTCGYYTQDEIRDVVKYAADRFITIVPEIEMPGHSSAAIAAYPELSCTPTEATLVSDNTPWAGSREGKQVQQTWGVFQDIYCPSDYTFHFMEDVLDEVMQLFPGKYIHVGGDEAPKTAWKNSPFAQQVIKQNNLKDEHELQSYFIQRIEKYINSKGRIMIGWDEILEGGLAQNAVVMSWRGEQGGIDAANQNHYVIMTPGEYVYFDHGQKEKNDSLNIGGYLPVEKVYNYEPIPKELPADKAKYVLGAQANVWTEYMAYPSKVEYMIFPRMSALSEVLWTPKAEKNWDDFERRLLVQFKRYDLWGVHYSRALFALHYVVVPTPTYNGVQIKLSTLDKGGKLLYAETNKHFPKNYTAPVTVRNSEDFLGLYSKNGQIADSVTVPIHFNKATGKKITLAEKPDNNYTGEGAFTLVNGIQNEAGIIHSKEFVGFTGKDVTATIDLGKDQKMDSVVVHALSTGGSMIYPPKSVDVFASTDGKNFKSLGSSDAFRQMSRTNGSIAVTFPTITTRYVKVIVHPLAAIPEGKRNAGEPPLVMLDEIEVD